MSQLTVITGDNGAGKSNLYRALRLLALTGNEGLISALAQEGGIARTQWAGDTLLTDRNAARLRLGFFDGDWGYAITLGYRPNHPGNLFPLDPEIKTESVFRKPGSQRQGVYLRDHALVTLAEGRRRHTLLSTIEGDESIFDHIVEGPVAAMRAQVRRWRFYDGFRCDRGAMTRQTQIGARTTALSHDGADLAAALRTIFEIGDVDGLHQAIDDAFPGTVLRVECDDVQRLSLSIQ